jgi:hypothetical protein
MNEQAIRNTIDDFQKFCRYIQDNKFDNELIMEQIPPS